ncbi:MAG: phage integrase SAM-like domain-containing protein [Candidatus Azobacteroides sp.]|nr:phage integrase SAM-like domain-containing protein [Candidatus Azobacteroides sp.]
MGDFKHRKSVTAKKVKNAFLGLNQRNEKLFQIFQEHNESKKKQVGKEISLKIYQKYECTLQRLKDFIKHEYNIIDICICEVTSSFVQNFEIYLKAEHGFSYNTTKLMQKVKNIIIMAFNNVWTKTN